MKKRIFIGAYPPEETIRRISSELTEVLESLPPQIPHNLRLAPESQWHLTVLFLGDRGEDEVRRAGEAMRRAAAGAERRRISLEAFVWGPGPENPRMLWLAADRASSDYLGALQAETEKACEAEGLDIAPEGRRQFWGHVTLGRFGRNSPRQIPLRRPCGAQFELESLRLMESELTPRRATHSLLEEAPLG